MMTNLRNNQVPDLTNNRLQIWNFDALLKSEWL